MIKNNKWKFLFSSIIILLPMLFAIPVKARGGIFADDFMGVFFIMPIIMLVTHIFCLFIESRQKHEQGRKITTLIYSIAPIISLYVGAIMLAIAMGYEFSLTVITAPFLGILFIVFGNYMPKARQNHTFGIKIKWTLENEENWNATHRFTGKLWVVMGVVMLFTVFLPDILFFIAFTLIMLAVVISSVVYSYRYYKKQLASGEAEIIEKKSNKKTIIFSVLASAVVVIILAVITFTGKLNFTFEEERLVIGASFGGGTEINYSDIESIDYREDGVGGTRISGFASARLLYGWFKNDEFGNYLRYTYAGGGDAIVMIVDGEEVVIADVDNDGTRALYEALIEGMK